MAPKWRRYEVLWIVRHNRSTLAYVSAVCKKQRPATASFVIVVLQLRARGSKAVAASVHRLSRLWRAEPYVWEWVAICQACSIS
jgi:hypothetical protein